MQRTEKPINYIYFFFDQFGKRVPLIAGANKGSNLDSEIHPSLALKKLILEQMPKGQTSRDVYVLIDGSEFKLGNLDKSEKPPKNKFRALNLNSDSLSEYGVIFYSHDKKDNKVPLATMSLKADELKWATLLDKEYSRILTGLAKECDLSPDLYVWISGTEFKLKKSEELDIKRIQEIYNSQKNDIAQ
ncbi:hypothetical protein [uncultured Lactobacillus sp.]|uniref:hypothetical protein n=1 Tax=uncultured Lactobacillus sp. TaxID=153152 RepID=UPI0025FEE45F|nr:hypothetical protein [uncultured Lactobacillus sp.]